MLKNLKRRVATILATIAMMLSMISALPLTAVTAYAEETTGSFSDGSSHTKSIEKSTSWEQDSKYTLSLDVKGGSDSSTEKQAADIIVVLDTSGSMGYDVDTGRETWGNNTRLNAAKSAITSFATSVTADNENVQFSLVTFASSANTGRTYTNVSDFNSAVNSTRANGGTNWEDALTKANAVTGRDGVAKYIIFISDGDPTYHSTKQQDDRGWNAPYGNGRSDDGHCYNLALTQAKAIVSAGKALYSINAFGDADKMQQLVTDLEPDADEARKAELIKQYYYEASNESALADALKSILSKINTTSYTNVSISDTLSSLAITSDKPSFTYTITDADGNAVDVKDNNDGTITTTDRNGNSITLKAATYDASSKKVTWDIAFADSTQGNFVLTDGWTYKVSFDVWPNDDAYKEVAKAKAGQTASADVVKDGETYYVYSNESAQVSYATVLNTETPITKDPVAYTRDQKMEVKLVEVPVTKTWDDAENQDGKRPTSVTVNLLADGKAVEGKTLTLSDDNKWTAKFEGLAAYDGTKDSAAKKADSYYSVSENEVEEYEATVSGDAKAGYTVTNKHTPETVDVSGTKTWVDADNQDGKRPESITVNLLANGEKVDSKTVTASDNWTYTFEGVAKYKDGKEITYTVTEEAVEGYTTEVKDFNITNTHAVEKTSVSGTKTWDDANNQDGKRPESITVNLLADGEKVDSKTVTADDNWSYSFTDLDKYKDGKEITYTITEDEVSEYTTEVNGYDITNTHTVEKTSVSGTKTWDDADNQDGKRPESITVNLLADGTQVASKDVTASDNWAYTFDNLDKYKEGKEISYTVTEKTVDGYETTIDGYNISNKHTPETTSVSGTKTWDDANNQDGKRPESITVNLLADGEKVDSKTVTASDNWTYTFEGVAKYKDGKEITYTVTEDTVDNYSTSYEGTNIKNSYTPEKTSVTVNKAWYDADDQDGKRADSVTVTLYANGEATDKALTLSAKNNWQGSFTELDKYSEGTVIAYTVKETEVAEYTTEVTGDATSGYTVKNTHTPEKVTVSGSKTWDDADNQDGKRPSSITVNLLADGEQVDSKDVTEADGWTYTFENLDKYKNGKEIVYTVTEKEVADYTSEVSGYNVTNTHTPETVTISGTKTWDDADNQDGKRPEKITVKLLANGEEVATTEASAETDWAYSFNDVPKFKDGQTIQYSVTEEAVEGYVVSTDGYNLTNTHTPETYSKVSVTKVWDDSNNANDRRPNNVTVSLYANGKVAEKDGKALTVTLDASNEWKYEFTELPVYANGEKIEYTIVETEINNYKATVTGDVNSGFTVTNTYTGPKKQVDTSDNSNIFGYAGLTLIALISGVGVVLFRKKLS